MAAQGWCVILLAGMYLRDYQEAGEAQYYLGAYFRHYNRERPHQALGYQTPAEVYEGSSQP